MNGKETWHAIDMDAQAKWDVKADKAAGELYLACSVEQRMHIDADQDDHVKIWNTLASGIPPTTSWGTFQCLG